MRKAVKFIPIIILFCLTSFGQVTSTIISPQKTNEPSETIMKYEEFLREETKLHREYTQEYYNMILKIIVALGIILGSVFTWLNWKTKEDIKKQFSTQFNQKVQELFNERLNEIDKLIKDLIEKIKIAQQDLSNSEQRIEDIKLAFDIKSTSDRQSFDEIHITNTDSEEEINDIEYETKTLIDLSETYIEKTSIPDYNERIKLKSEYGRKMGEIILRNNLSKEILLQEHEVEGMYLALAYSIQLRPDKESLSILNKISKLTKQLYTKYTILIGYNTLARTGFIKRNQVKDIYNLIIKFKSRADAPLLKNIENTISLLKILEPDIENKFDFSFLNPKK